jgi:hypothetical protein
MGPDCSYGGVEEVRRITSGTLRSAEVLLSIVGLDYDSFIHSDVRVSRVEYEYDLAGTLGMRRIVCLLDEDAEASIPKRPRRRQDDNRERQARFRMRVAAQSGDVSTFSTAQELAANVRTALQASNARQSNQDAKRSFFICYAKEDRAVVHSLYDRLVGDGVSCWIDEHDLVGGDDWRFEITRQIRQSRYFIACLSGKSVTKSGYVHSEQKYALEVAAEQPEGRAFIIPACLEPCAVPEKLKHLHSINIYLLDGYEMLRAVQRV